jgi:two-component system catabolic regulation response regulator CreB/two-component system response regulator ChvI
MNIPKIAHIDVDPELRAVLAKGLQKHGFEVHSYDSAKSFLPDYKVGLFDLIIFDTFRTGAWDLLRHMKRIDPKQKFMWLTAFEIYYEEFKKMFPDVDCAFVRKPVSIKMLVSEINKTLGIDLAKVG